MSQGATLDLLRAVATTAEPRYLDLYREVERLNPSKEFHTSEILALSVKLSVHGLSRNRYDACLHWRPADRARIWDSVVRAAPTTAVAEHLARPGTAARRWVEGSPRFFAYLAVDHDARVFKIYLFRHDAAVAFEALDESARRCAADEAAYIRCLAIDMDDPERQAVAPYHRSALPRFEDALEPSFRLGDGPTGVVLRDAPARGAVLAMLRALLHDRPLRTPPIVKVRADPRSAGAGGPGGRPDLALSVNVGPPGALLRVNAHRESLRGLGGLLGCGPAFEDWLAAVAPFDCFLSYLSLGPDYVTLYVKSTPWDRRRPRDPGAAHGAAGAAAQPEP